MSKERNWSPQQAAIFDWFQNGSGNLVVRARAGTGKTTTILEGINRAPDASILLAAFNKRIAEELVSKLSNPRAEAKTLHAAGFGIVRRYWENVRVDEKRDADLAARVCGQVPDAILRLVAKLAVRAKESLPFGTLDEMIALAEAIECVPDDEWEDDGYDATYVAMKALQQMGASKARDGRVSFADMLFVPVANGWVKPRFDLVVIDEAQDMGATQLLLAQKLSRSRVVVVGDDRQAIYGFRGADSGSIDRMKSELGAVELGLTITYRCPRVVVAHAARLVPDYAAAETAPEGTISTIKPDALTDAAGAGDFVLSRKNAPLAGTCLGFLRAGKRARIEGRDVGAGLVAIVRKLKAKSMPDFVAKLTRWMDREIVRAKGRKNPDARISLVTDQAETLQAIAEGLTGVPELVTRIEGLFVDTNGAGHADVIVCSSVHKAKGLEAERVFILEATLYPRGNREDREEQNIEYVAVTRAKSDLVWVA